MTDTALRPLAVVTGASSGIGYELAKLFVENNYDLVIAADQPAIVEAADAVRRGGAPGGEIQPDKAPTQGGAKRLAAGGGRPVDALAANAGQGLGKGFLDQDFGAITQVVNTNITGTLYLLHKLGAAMRERGRGRILLTGSIAGLMPGTYQAVYNGTKAFIDSFSFALRAELKDSGVTVTCLLPGATDTEFFERADMMDTKVGQAKKEDPAKTAKTGFDAMMKGEGDVVSGFMNKVQAAVAAVTPQSMLAALHRGMAEPGSGEK